MAMFLYIYYTLVIIALIYLAVHRRKSTQLEQSPSVGEAMKFKVGDEVITRGGDVCKVISIEGTYTWNEIAQPICVLFNTSKVEHYSPDGSFHPRKKTIDDIRLLTKLEKAMK